MIVTEEVRKKLKRSRSDVINDRAENDGRAKRIVKDSDCVELIKQHAIPILKQAYRIKEEGSEISGVARLGGNSSEPNMAALLIEETAGSRPTDGKKECMICGHRVNIKAAHTHLDLKRCRDSLDLVHTSYAFLEAMWTVEFD